MFSPFFVCILFEYWWLKKVLLESFGFNAETKGTPDNSLLESRTDCWV